MTRREKVADDRLGKSGKKTYFEQLLDVHIKADIELKRLELKQAMLTSATVKAYPHDTPGRVGNDRTRTQGIG